MANSVLSRYCGTCSSGDVVLDYFAGDIVCRGCGNVISSKIIDEGDETRVYADDIRHKETRSSGSQCFRQ